MPCCRVAYVAVIVPVTHRGDGLAGLRVGAAGGRGARGRWGARASRVAGSRGRAACLDVLWHVQQSFCRRSRGAVRRGCVWGCCRPRRPGPLGRPGPRGLAGLAAELHALMSVVACAAVLLPSLPRCGSAGLRVGVAAGRGARGRWAGHPASRALAAELHVLLSSWHMQWSLYRHSPRCGSAGCVWGSLAAAAPGPLGAPGLAGSRARWPELHVLLCCGHMQRSLYRHSRGAVRRGCVWGLLPAAAPGAAGAARGLAGPRGRSCMPCCLVAYAAVLVPSLPRCGSAGLRVGVCWRPRRPGPLGAPGLAGSRALAAELHALMSCGICSSPCAVTPEVRFGGATCGGHLRPRRPGPLGSPGLAGSRALAAELHVLLSSGICRRSLYRHSKGAVRRGCVWGSLPAAAPGAAGPPASWALAAKLHALLSCGICSSPCTVTSEVRFGGAACGGRCRPARGHWGAPGLAGSRALAAELHVLLSSRHMQQSLCHHSRGAVRPGYVWGLLAAAAPGAAGPPASRVVGSGAELHVLLSSGICSSPCAITPEVRFGRATCGGCWAAAPGAAGGPRPRGLVAELHALLSCGICSSRCTVTPEVRFAGLHVGLLPASAPGAAGGPGPRGLRTELHQRCRAVLWHMQKSLYLQF